MNADDELGTLLTDSLTRTVDGMDRAPLTLGDVRSRAGRIRRHRALGAVAGVAAVIAVVVPAALGGIGGTAPDRPGPAESPSQTASPTEAVETPRLTPMVDGTVVLDPDASVGDDPRIAWSRSEAPDTTTVHLGDGSVLTTPRRYVQLVDLGDRVVGLYAGPGGRPAVDVLDPDGSVLSTHPVDPGSSGLGALAVDERHTSVGWIGTDGKARLVTGATDDVAVSRQTVPGTMPQAVAVAGRDCDRSATCTVYAAIGGYGGGVAGVEVSDAGPGRVPRWTDLTSLADLSLGADVRLGTSARVSPTAPNGEYCAVARALDSGRQLWEDCDAFLTTLSPDGAFVLSSYAEGYGATSVSILDAATGSRVLEVSGQDATFWHATWEDESHVVFSAEADGRVQLFRLGVDGSLERAGDHSVEATGAGTPWTFELR